MSTEQQRRKCLSELCCLQKKILSIHDNVTSSTAETHLYQYAKTIRSYKAELRKLCLESYTLDVSDSDEIYSLESQLDEDVFDCCLKIRRLLPSANTSLAPSLLLESDNSITPQIEKELQGVPDTSLVNATSSTLENTNSHSDETQTLTSDSQSSHDSIDTCEIPLLMVVTDEPSTHPSCEAIYSIDCCPEVVNSGTSLATLSSGHSTHKLRIPIITYCAADFSHINGVDSLLDRSIQTSIGVAILIESYLILFLHVCHGRRHSTLNTFAHSRLCIEIICSLTPSHVTWSHRLFNWLSYSMVMNTLDTDCLIYWLWLLWSFDCCRCVVVTCFGLTNLLVSSLVFELLLSHWFCKDSCGSSRIKHLYCISATVAKISHHSTTAHYLM